MTATRTEGSTSKPAEQVCRLLCPLFQKKWKSFHGIFLVSRFSIEGEITSEEELVVIKRIVGNKFDFQYFQAPSW